MAADIAPALRDRRTRQLAVLGLITLALVALAALSLWIRSAEFPGPIARTPAFPELRARQGDVARIDIAFADGAFAVQRDAEGRWTVPGKGGYPADLDQVKRAINGLVQIDLVERKTDNPARHAALNLVEPAEGGEGVVLKLSDSGGTILASLVAGRVVSVPGPATDGAIFVRKGGEAQTWLARGFLTLQTDQTAWLDKTTFMLDRSRLASVLVAPKEGPAYTLDRASPEAADFTLLEMPEGKQATAASALNGVAGAIVGFSFDDVRPLGDFNQEAADRIVFRTFDGLAVTLAIGIEEGEYWASLSAVAEASGEGEVAPEVVAEATEITTRLGGWLFNLPRYKGQLMTTPRDSLIMDIPPPPPEQPETPETPQGTEAPQ